MAALRLDEIPHVQPPFPLILVFVAEVLVVEKSAIFAFDFRRVTQSPLVPLVSLHFVDERRRSIRCSHRRQSAQEHERMVSVAE